MGAVLCLREATHFQSMELERPEAICGLESGTRSRLWCTRGHCACKQEVAFFGLRSAGAEVACLNQVSSGFSWLRICRHRGDRESNVCVVLTAEFRPAGRSSVGRIHVAASKGTDGTALAIHVGDSGRPARTSPLSHCLQLPHMR